MNYFEEIEFGPKCLTPCPYYKIYVYDVISIMKETQADTHFNHLNEVNPHRKFNMESPGNDASIPFLNMKSLLNDDHPIQMSV